MPPVAQPAASHAAGLAELERLARLRDQGAISRREYDAAKAKILAAWAGTEPGGMPLAVPEYSLFRQLTHPPAWARAGTGIVVAVLIIATLAVLARRNQDVAAPDAIAVRGPTPPAVTAAPGTSVVTAPTAPARSSTPDIVSLLQINPSALAPVGYRPYWGAVAYERISLAPYEEAYVFQSHKQMPSPLGAYPCAALAVGFSWVARGVTPSTSGQAPVEFIYSRQGANLVIASGAMGQASSDWCSPNTVRNPNPFPVEVTLTYVALVRQTAIPHR